MLSSLRSVFREDRSFAVLALATFAVPLLFNYYTTDNFEIIKYTLFLVLTGWALIAWLRQNRDFKMHTGAGILLAVFLGSALLSVLFSIDKPVSFFGFFPRFTSGFVFLFAWSIFLFLLCSICDIPKWKILAKILVFDSLLISVVGIVQSLGLGYYEGAYQQAILRAPSLLGNPNFSSMFVVAALPFAIVAFFEAKQLWAKIYYGVISCLSLWAIASFTSRGSILALAFVLVLLGFGMVITRFSKRVLAVTVIALAVVASLSVMYYTMARPESLQKTFDRSDENITLRLYAWDMARQAVMERPWFGIGLGTFQIYYAEHRGAHTASQTTIFDDPHNLPLHLAANGGLILALSFLAIVGIALFYGARRALAGDRYALASVVSILGFFVAACFTPVSVPLFLLLAVVVAGLLLENLQSFAVPFRKLAVVPGVIISALLIVWGIDVFASDAIFFWGRDAYMKGNYTQAYKLTRVASVMNPTNQAYFVYEVGSEIKLKKDPEIIRSGIAKVIAMDPVPHTTYDRAANLYYLWFDQTRQREQFDGAMENLMQAAKIEPYRAERYRRMALYYFDANELDKSLEAVKTSLSLDQRQLQGWVLIAKIYQLQNNRTAMINSLESAFKASPETMQLKYLLEIAKNEQDAQKVPIQILIQEGMLE